MLLRVKTEENKQAWISLEVWSVATDALSLVFWDSIAGPGGFRVLKEYILKEFIPDTAVVMWLPNSSFTVV